MVNCTTLRVVTAVQPTNAKIFNFCWGTTVPEHCSQPPDMPNIAPGTSFVIKADIYNLGPSGKVRTVFKDGTTILSDQNTTLGKYPGAGLWSPSPNFSWTMPSRDVSLKVEAYGWDGTNWTLTDTKTVTISRSVPTCIGIGISFTGSVNRVAGDKITFTATTTPTTQPFIVIFKLRDGTNIGSCSTSNGSCQIVWDTTGKPSGTYYIKAEVSGQCVSIEAPVNISPPIKQWNLNITVKDVNTNNPISGATVVAKGQIKTTDANGYVTFRLDEGIIDISISKTGYNPYTTVESLFSDLTKTYWQSPIVPTTGSLRFITIPTETDVYLYSETTKRGTTDSSGALSITGLTAGTTPYKVKKTGYNDSTGTVTVVGGIITDVYVTLTVVTPTTGSVCLKSTPSGASISIDDTLISGKTTALSAGTCTFESGTVSNLSPGVHSYKLALTGYQDKTGAFTIIAAQTVNIDAGILTPITGVGILEITSGPISIGARIYIDNVDKERVTPATISNIPAGSHTWKLILSGYEDKSGTFSITAGQTTTINAGDLVKKEGIGTGVIILGVGLAFLFIVTRK